MNNLSFFKLPMIFTVMFWFTVSLIPMILPIISHRAYPSFADYMVYLLYSLLVYGMPKILLTLFVASLALYRCNIYQVTVKNIIYLAIIGLVGTVATVLYNMFLYSVILSYMYESIGNYFYHIMPYSSYSIFFFFTKIIIDSILCLIIGLISYYGILLLQNAFDRDINTKLINSQNSAKISLKLFITLFMFAFLLFLGSLILSFIRVYSYQESYIFTMSYLIMMIVIASILYFSIRNSFTNSFAELPISRIIKSAMLSFVLSLVINVIIAAVMIFFIMILAFGYSRGSDVSMLLVVLFGGALQLGLICVIMRLMSRRYFAKTNQDDISSHNEIA